MEPITGLFSINAAFPHLRVQPNEHRTKVRLNFLLSPILILQPNEHRTQRTKVRFNFFCTDSKLYALSVGDLVGLLQKVNQSWPSESLPWLIPELYGPCIDSDHNKCCDRNQCIHLFLLGAAAFFYSAELVDSRGLIHSGAWPIIFWECGCGRQTLWFWNFRNFHLISWNHGDHGNSCLVKSTGCRPYYHNHWDKSLLPTLS